MPLKLVLSRRWVCLVLFINYHIYVCGVIFPVPGFKSKFESCTFFVKNTFEHIIVYQVIS